MAAGGNKYGAKKTPCHQGHTHDSGREAKRCNDLHLLQRAGSIDGLIVQPQFWFVVNGRQLKGRNGHRLGFKPDFQYMEANRVIVEDSKGMVVRDYPLRSALFRALFPQFELREV